MNKARRKQIADLSSALEDLIGEEREALDNLPESLQSSEKGEAMQAAIDAMESARDSLEEAQTA